MSCISHSKTASNAMYATPLPGPSNRNASPLSINAAITIPHFNSISHMHPKANYIVCHSNRQWRYERAHSIGASAVPAILGVSPFISPHQLAVTMRNELNGHFDYSESFAMLRGHAYESGVAYLFSHFSGCEIIQSSARAYIVRRDDIPFMHASPDRMYWIEENGPKHGKIAEFNKGVLECKTTRSSVNPDELPLHWYLQLQAQLGITGYYYGALAYDQLHKAKREAFDYRFVNLNDELFNFIVEKCRRFWLHSVKGGCEPENILPELQASFPALFPNKRKVSFFQRLRLNKDIADCISGSAHVLVGNTHKPIPYPIREESLSLPEPEEDDTSESWLSRIWGLPKNH